MQGLSFGGIANIVPNIENLLKVSELCVRHFRGPKMHLKDLLFLKVQCLYLLFHILRLQAVLK